MPKLIETDFRWIEVIALATLSGVTAAMIVLGIRQELEVNDVLGVAGAIAGAGLGAWLAATAAHAGIKARRDNELSERREFVRQLLETVGEEMQAGSHANTESKLLDFSVTLGENQLRRHAARAALALGLVEDANLKVGADFRVLRALHTAMRTLRQTKEQCEELLDGERSEQFGRDAMRFVQTNRNSVRISIDLALRTLDGLDERNGTLVGLFATPTVAKDAEPGPIDGSEALPINQVD